MAFSPGDWVSPTRVDNPTGPLFNFPRSDFTFAVVAAAAAGLNTILTGPGVLIANVPDAQLDWLSFGPVLPTFRGWVRPIDNPSPEFTGVAVGFYHRILSGTTQYNEAVFVMVAMLNGKGYYEIPRDELEELL